MLLRPVVQQAFSDSRVLYLELRMQNTQLVLRACPGQKIPVIPNAPFFYVRLIILCVPISGIHA